MWITLLKRCGKVSEIYVDGEPEIALLTYEYSSHECYGRIDGRVGNSAAQVFDDTQKLI
jgi:hypothetical protein